MSTTTEVYSPGLEGVIAGETAVSTVTGGLRYRGYPITELATQCSFEEVAYLLLYGELPTADQLNAFQSRLGEAGSIPKALSDLLAAVPKDLPPMDVLRSAVSVLAHFDPEAGDMSREANLRKSERLLAQAPIAIAEHYRASHGKKPIEPRKDLGIAAHFLYLIDGKEAAPEAVKALDVSLILYAEHEFNASTFTSRVVCSTLSDMHSSIVAAIGALKGPLHGGANEKVMDILKAVGEPDNVDQWMKDAFARKERIMGFGHRVYKTGDVRAKILKEFARKFADAAGNTKWEDMADRMEAIMQKEKNLLPNLDWPAGRLYYSMGLDIPLYTPIFVMSRISGWAAHVIEQLDNNRLIRPRARYTGPDLRAVTPITERS